MLLGAALIVFFIGAIRHEHCNATGRREE